MLINPADILTPWLSMVQKFNGAWLFFVQLINNFCDNYRTRYTELEIQAHLHVCYIVKYVSCIAINNVSFCFSGEFKAVSLNKYHIVENKQKSMNQTDVSRGPGDNTISGVKSYTTVSEWIRCFVYLTREGRHKLILSKDSHFENLERKEGGGKLSPQFLLFNHKEFVFSRKVFIQIMQHIYQYSYSQQPWIIKYREGIQNSMPQNIL